MCLDESVFWLQLHINFGSKNPTKSTEMPGLNTHFHALLQRCFRCLFILFWVKMTNAYRINFFFEQVGPNI